MATDDAGTGKQRWLRLATSKQSAHAAPVSVASLLLFLQLHLLVLPASEKLLACWLANVVIGVRLTAADDETVDGDETWLTLHQ